VTFDDDMARPARALRSIVGIDNVLADPDLRAGYETDWTGRFGGPGSLVVRPDNADQVARVLDRAKIRRIVEVGVLLGNHSAFLLKAFAPDRMTLIDADPANIPFIERTIFYNLPDSRGN
jgi:hypothetical protein